LRIRNDVGMVVNAVLGFRSGTDLGKKGIMEMVGIAFKMAKRSSDHVAARFELGRRRPTSVLMNWMSVFERF